MFTVDVKQQHNIIRLKTLNSGARRNIKPCKEVLFYKCYSNLITLLIEKKRNVLFVTMETALMQKEYFVIRYFNPQLWSKKRQNLTLKKGHYKVFNRIFFAKKCSWLP